MKIILVTDFYNNSGKSKPHNTAKKLSFKSLPCLLSSYTDCYGVQRCSQHTTDLREDLDYDKLAGIVYDSVKSRLPQKRKKFLLFRRKSVQNFVNSIEILPKVTIYSMAGSDATEAYAMANSIIGKMGFENAQKYVFPIHVSDVSKKIIEQYGEKGVVFLSDTEIEKLKYINKYLTCTGNKYPQHPGYKEYILAPEFRNCFTFEVMDLQEKIEKFPPKKENEFCIFAIRNCLAQAFGSLETDILLDKMAEHLPHGSLAIFGDYDTKIRMPSVFAHSYHIKPIDYKNNIYKIFSVKKFFGACEELLNILGK